MSKKQKMGKVIIKIVIILLVLVALIGISYSWFKTVIQGNENAKTITLQAGKLEITYVDGPELNKTDIIPGDVMTKTFSIENTGDRAATYKIAWKTLENNFINRSDLIYSVTSTNGGGTLSQTQLPDSENHILMMDNIVIAQGVTQSYTLTIQYLSTQYNQSSDKGRTLTGTIEVLDVEDTTIEAQTSTGSIIAETGGETLYGMTKAALFDEIYPVGSIYTSISNNPTPESMFGGKWVRIKDTFLLAAGDTYSADDGTHTTATAGEANHVLTSAEIPSHTHGSSSLTGSWNTLSWTGSVATGIVGISSALYNLKATTGGTQYGNVTNSINATHTHDSFGGGQSHNNMPPYLTVYVWKRTN